jgi:hypothetical protein
MVIVMIPIATTAIIVIIASAAMVVAIPIVAVVPVRENAPGKHHGKDEQNNCGYDG